MMGIKKYPWMCQMNPRYNWDNNILKITKEKILVFKYLQNERSLTTEYHIIYDFKIL